MPAVVVTAMATAVLLATTSTATATPSPALGPWLPHAPGVGTVEQPGWYRQAKFGLFIHFAPVSQWGAELSWPLQCRGNPPGSFPCSHQGPGGAAVVAHNESELRAQRLAYEGLAATFNPAQFNATAMMTLAQAAGFRYVVPTAVHCDGYAIYNSTLGANYSVLSSPFGRDMYREYADAARALGLRVGAYYCPSLWNSDDYWAPDHLTVQARGCYSSYVPAAEPARWQRYLAFIHGQISELVDQYAPDLFWFDCVNPVPVMDTKLEALTSAARAANPDVVITTRDGGLWQDFVESADHGEAVVETILDNAQMDAGHYFEVPGTLAGGARQWGYSPTAQYRPARDILHALASITAKGGNYLLNLGPGPTGLWDPKAVAVLQDVAAWMALNAEAIHGATPVWPYEYTEKLAAPGATDPSQSVTGNTFYTTASTSDPRDLYVLWPRPNATDDGHLPPTLTLPFVRASMVQGGAASLTGVSVLGAAQGLKSTWQWQDGGLELSFAGDPGASVRWLVVFKLTFAAER